MGRKNHHYSSDEYSNDDSSCESSHVCRKCRKPICNSCGKTSCKKIRPACSSCKANEPKSCDKGKCIFITVN
uniref:Uncharacterized protein n=1 Tax=viral metagenome TaxID=1070528 RepID=A0A6C0B8D6_9ZZZZ